MTSKEKFLTIKEHIIYPSRHYRLGTTFVQLKEPHEKFELNAALDEIEKDLDRLEKYDKAKELIKEKHVDLSEILYISKNKYVKELWADVYNRGKRCPNQLTQEEFNFILKIFK